ncbi:MAG: NAD-dependent epimerase/dehydratase family protein [Deltaproteobacteria bacterium]|nr:NAD-dependent epimerase/dehydratase family protein [Deltaproteobacteria bacterium]MBW2413592.1 NAD-dependent epimerase/dehydratase family protein [Deltaproteobacteria bacterium]
MRRVLVTHLDSSVGRRLVKALYHDPDVSLVLGVGTGPPPSFLDPYRDKCFYERIDLAKARHLNSFVRSERFLRARCDSVIHLPFTSEIESEHIPGNVPTLVSETRRLLAECRKREEIQRFVYLSTAFVYRAEPGNGNLVGEDTLLGFDVEGAPTVRAWIDADLICQGELKDPDLKMTILRCASIVGDGGQFLMSPPLEDSRPALGFDPLLSVVADRDVARALLLALHGDEPGIYNVAGREVFPRSELRPPASRLGPLPVPRVVSGAVSLLRGMWSGGEGVFDRYGIVLDTRHAQEVLGFEPLYRIELRGRSGDRRVDTVRCR